MHFLFKSHPRLSTGLLLVGALIFAPLLLSKPHPAQPVQALPTTPFLDMHCHSAGLGAGGSGCFVSDQLRHSFKLRFYLKSFGVTEEEIMKEGDTIVITRLAERLAASQHVNRAVVLALDGVINAQGELDRAQTEIYIPNDYLATEVAKHPNLRWGASVNPYRPDALARLEWARAHGAVLVKWLPAVQHIDPADERLIPFYQKMVELHLPLLTHTGNERSFTQSRDELCDPERLRLPLRQGVTIIAAHAATTGKFANERSLDRLARLMPEFPHLYADISSLTQINKRGYLAEVLRRPEFQHRLIYGTDYPLIAINQLVSPWYFLPQLSFRQSYAFARIKNPWDRDVALKQALGVPTEIWTKADTILAP